MRRKVYAVMLAALMLGVAACGKEADTPNQTETGTENTDDTQKETPDAKPEKSDVLAGIYPEGDELEELVMGTRVNGEQVEFCKVKVPSNYWIGAGYLNEEGYDNSFEMANGDDEVGKAISEGLLSGTDKIYTFTVNNAILASETTYLTGVVFAADEQNYEEVKQTVKEYKIIGSGETEAFYFEDHREAAISDMLMCYKLGDKGMLQISYIGPVSDELGLDQLAQSIYELITVTE